MKIRRVVFGEPKPGESQFAAIVQRADESVSYCNRGGPRQHDRVTDVPFTVPALGLNFEHPAPLTFLRCVPPVDDAWGIFSYHHVELYETGAAASGADPRHAVAARLCRAIYDRGVPEAWDARGLTQGVAWAVRRVGDTVYVVFRGSDALFDWLRDLTGFDPAAEYPALGRMWDGFVAGVAEAWAEIWALPMVSGATELVITGHSLGAARASVATAFAITGIEK